MLEWGAAFPDTVPFANYISHMQNVCCFIGSPVTWLTPAVRDVARGLKKCQDDSFRFPNFIRSSLLLRIIQQETAAIEFPQSCWMSFLLALRTPSENLKLTRPYRGDEISAFSPQREKSLIGMRTAPDGGFLVAKLKWRKNLACGCILRRPCFCFGDRASARACCPAHVMWPAIRARVPSGSPLFTAFNQRNFDRIIRAVFTRLGVTDATRYSSHGFRRGTAQELKETGSPWTAVATAGLWRSPAFRGYVDMTADVEQGIRKLVPIDSDSDTGPEAE